jgi:ribonucleoside-diphosphate reductase beta chain
VGELDFGHDGADATLMNAAERRVLLQTLAFFASSDMIVNDRLVASIIHDLPSEEWKAAYQAQCFMESVHTETYNRLIDALVSDQDEKDGLFNALNTIPTIAAKRDFYILHSDPSNDFQTRLLCQLLVEGVHFSASFALIAWLRKRFPGHFEATTKANELIMRDEGVHAKMACTLLKRELDAGKTVHNTTYA